MFLLLVGTHTTLASGTGRRKKSVGWACAIIPGDHKYCLLKNKLHGIYLCLTASAGEHNKYQNASRKYPTFLMIKSQGESWDLQDDFYV